jgi:hypothetical protein
MREQTRTWKISVRYYNYVIHFGLIVLDIEGFDQLRSILTAGGSTSYNTARLSPAFHPSRRQLIVAATLIVHPRYNNQAKKVEDIRASDDAYQFLKTVLKTFGTVESDLADAFIFDPQKSDRRKQRHLQTLELQTSENEEEGYLKLQNKYADEQSVFQQKEDVWQVVGWAFNTAAQYPIRWQRWKLFLGILLDVYERDIEERLRLYQQNRDLLHQSPAIEVLRVAERTMRRRILKAIFANGTKASLQEFPEVFKNETREVKEAQVSTKREAVKPEEGLFGDYDDSQDADADMEDSSENLSINSDESSGDESSTDIDANRLRARFLALVSLVSRFTLLSLTFGDVQSSKHAGVYLPRSCGSVRYHYGDYTAPGL